MPKPTTVDNDFKCEYCHATYTNKQNLNRHVKTAHGIANTARPATVAPVQVPVAPVAPAPVGADLIANLISQLQALKAVPEPVPEPAPEPARHKLKTVVPTLDLGLMLVEWEDDEDATEWREGLNDQMLYHLQSKCDFDEIVSFIIDGHYDIAFHKTYKNQLYFNYDESGSYLTFLDGDIAGGTAMFGELDATEDNVCKLYKLMCDAITYYYSTVHRKLVDRLVSSEDDDNELRSQLDRVQDILSQVSSSRCATGNGRIITNPRSELKSITTTRSLKISYKVIQDILPKFNLLLEIPL
jgi:hypothetical protein